jgi:hypothetical protein
MMARGLKGSINRPDTDAQDQPSSNPYFRLATRGRPIQMGQKRTSMGAIDAYAGPPRSSLDSATMNSPDETEPCEFRLSHWPRLWPPLAVSDLRMHDFVPPTLKEPRREQHNTRAGTQSRIKH